MNLRAKRKGMGTRVVADGEFGPKSRALWLRLAPLLGFQHNLITVRHQAFMRWPHRRPDAMKDRARKRVAQWKRDLRAARRGPRAALRWAGLQVGITERPSGSNGGPHIDTWERALGFGRVPWCGIFVGTALKTAGVRGISSRVAGVALIEEDAKSGRNGFRSWHASTHGKPGDAVVLFGHGVHVGLIEKRVQGGYQTVEGNTSAGSAGSQSNGGGVFRRFRSFGVVRGCARPRY